MTCIFTFQHFPCVSLTTLIKFFAGLEWSVYMVWWCKIIGRCFVTNTYELD